MPIQNIATLSASEFVHAARHQDLHLELADLERRSGDSNPFYESWMLVHAAEHLATGRDVRFVLVRNAAGLLCGVFPFLIDARMRHVVVLRLWRHSYCFLCTPLLDARHVDECADLLGRWLQSRAAPARIVEFHSYADDGVFAQQFLPRLTRHRRWVRDARQSERAIFNRHSDDRLGMSGRHQKETRRLERRLGDFGEVSYQALSSGDDCEPWLAHFMRLEALGWKGRENTAIASNGPDEAYFVAIGEEAHRRGRLQVFALKVGDKPIAMKINFLAAPGSYAFKIAYDEGFAKFSPGILLEIFNRQRIVESADIDWMDSCAEPGHAMIERLWTGRRPLGSQRISGQGLLPRAIVRGIPHLRRARSTINQFLNRQTDSPT